MKNGNSIIMNGSFIKIESQMSILENTGYWWCGEFPPPQLTICNKHYPKRFTFAEVINKNVCGRTHRHPASHSQIDFSISISDISQRYKRHGKVINPISSMCG